MRNPDEIPEKRSEDVQEPVNKPHRVSVDGRRARAMWAQVELWRWEFGELPQSDDTRKQDERVGLRNMAAALLNGDRGAMPSPYDVATVLEYMADRLESPTPVIRPTRNQKKRARKRRK